MAQDPFIYVGNTSHVSSPPPVLHAVCTGYSMSRALVHGSSASCPRKSKLIPEGFLAVEDYSDEEAGEEMSEEEEEEEIEESPPKPAKKPATKREASGKVRCQWVALCL